MSFYLAVILTVWVQYNNGYTQYIYFGEGLIEIRGTMEMENISTRGQQKASDESNLF